MAMKKISARAITAGATRFAARMQAELDARVKARAAAPVRNGRVFYWGTRRSPREVRALVTDGQSRVWSARGPTCRDAYQAVLTQLENAAGAGDLTAKTLLGVIEGPPRRAKVAKPGPAQGSLL